MQEIHLPSYNRDVYWDFDVVPSLLKQTNMEGCWGWIKLLTSLREGDALESVGTAVNTPVSLAIRQPAGWTGCSWGGYRLLVSSWLCAAISLPQYHWCSANGDHWCSVLITHCRVLLSLAMHIPYQFVMFPVVLLSRWKLNNFLALMQPITFSPPEGHPKGTLSCFIYHRGVFFLFFIFQTWGAPEGNLNFKLHLLWAQIVYSVHN